MAEAIFSHKVNCAGLKMKIEADSCGTAAYHIGEHPDPRTVNIVKENNISIGHTVRQLSLEDFYHFDHIVAMDYANLSDILYMKPEDTNVEIHLMRDFDPNPETGEVPDPYYGGTDGFQHVFDILNRSSDELLESIIRNK